MKIIASWDNSSGAPVTEFFSAIKDVQETLGLDDDEGCINTFSDGFSTTMVFSKENIATAEAEIQVSKTLESGLSDLFDDEV